jgi:hypothetical protein
MAMLIKIDNKFINLDNVTEIHSYELHGWNVIVYYANTTASGESPPQQDFEHFTGEEAAALRHWLEKNAVDVMAWHRAEGRKVAHHNGHREFAHLSEVK